MPASIYIIPSIQALLRSWPEPIKTGLDLLITVETEVFLSDDDDDYKSLGPYLYITMLARHNSLVFAIASPLLLSVVYMCVSACWLCPVCWCLILYHCHLVRITRHQISLTRWSVVVYTASPFRRIMTINQIYTFSPFLFFIFVIMLTTSNEDTLDVSFIKMVKRTTRQHGNARPPPGERRAENLPGNTNNEREPPAWHFQLQCQYSAALSKNGDGQKGRGSSSSTVSIGKSKKEIRLKKSCACAVAHNTEKEKGK